MSDRLSNAFRRAALHIRNAYPKLRHVRVQALSSRVEVSYPISNDPTLVIDYCEPCAPFRFIDEMARWSVDLSSFSNYLKTQHLVYSSDSFPQESHEDN